MLLATACRLQWSVKRRQRGHETLGQFALSVRLLVGKALRRMGRLEEAELAFKVLAGEPFLWWAFMSLRLARSPLAAPAEGLYQPASPASLGPEGCCEHPSGRQV